MRPSECALLTAPMTRFDDTIGIFPEFIDGYNILILPTTGRYFQVGQQVNGLKRSNNLPFFQVPYGCLVPPSVQNLLVAGRLVHPGQPQVRGRGQDVPLRHEEHDGLHSDGPGSWHRRRRVSQGELG